MGEWITYVTRGAAVRTGAVGDEGGPVGMRTRRGGDPYAPGGPRARALAEGFTWTRNDALVAIGSGAVDLTGYSIGTMDAGLTLSVPAFGLLVLASVALPARRRHPVAVFVAALVLAAVFNIVSPLSPGFTANLAVALYSVAMTRGPAVVTAGVLAVLPIPLIGRNGRWVDSGWGVFGNLVAAGIVVAAGVAVRHRQREVAAHRKLLADRAVAEERRRIARELHDIVAHHITTMQLMAGGARANLAHDPEAARDALVTLEGSGRMALREMRQLLDVLRAGEEPEHVPPAPQPGAGDLGRIITESRLAGMETRFTVHGRARPLPPTVGLTVFRIVQEALTNARKHAGPARADVRLTYGPDEITVEVSDDGAGAPPPRPLPSPSEPVAGYGLMGMRERVALQGGTLEAAPIDGGGFRVAARMPVATGAAGGEGE
ncbi:sensor histidine kinase [Streptomyces sp. NPDC002039]|uniref:sensor histidine kinase n=1 Tax=Streptomyces sp. NPDC002039 TaxID=3154660 RepID=UPI003329020E